MVTAVQNQDQALQRQISTSLRKATAHKAKLQHHNTRYVLINLVLGSMATLLTGQAALSEKLPATTWKITCAIASGLTLSATISSGLQKQLTSPELLIQSSECVGKLKALKVEVEGIEPTESLDASRDKYEQILTEFHSVDC